VLFRCAPGWASLAQRGAVAGRLRAGPPSRRTATPAAARVPFAIHQWPVAIQSFGNCDPGQKLEVYVCGAFNSIRNLIRCKKRLTTDELQLSEPGEPSGATCTPPAPPTVAGTRDTHMHMHVGQCGRRVTVPWHCARIQLCEPPAQYYLTANVSYSNYERANWADRSRQIGYMGFFALSLRHYSATSASGRALTTAAYGFRWHAHTASDATLCWRIFWWSLTPAACLLSPISGVRVTLTPAHTCIKLSSCASVRLVSGNSDIDT
jgi:hypothetical protein